MPGDSPQAYHARPRDGQRLGQARKSLTISNTVTLGLIRNEETPF